jgi:hypothetical protein
LYGIGFGDIEDSVMLPPPPLPPLTVTVYGAFALWPAESFIDTVKEYVPPVVGVP